MPDVIAGFSVSNGTAFLLHGDGGAIERLLGRPSRRLLGPQIDQHQMRVGAAGDDVEPFGLQRLGQHLRVLDHALAHRA